MASVQYGALSNTIFGQNADLSLLRQWYSCLELNLAAILGSTDTL